MSIDNQIASLVEGIEAAHEARVAAVSDIVKETHHTLEHFNRKREEMAREQKSSLASDRSARTSQVQEARARYGKEEKEIATKTFDFLSTSERERKQEFARLMEEIRHSVAAIEQDTGSILAEFDHSHREMAEALRASLDHDTRERSDTTHDLMAGFVQEHEKMTRTVQELAETTHATLADFSSDLEQARAHWQRLSRTMNARHAGQPKKQKKG